MSPISTQYASAVATLATPLDVLTKGNPDIVKALPFNVLARAAGVDPDSFLRFAAGATIVDSCREKLC